MKKTLKRELKLFEIVESDAFVVSVCISSLFLFQCIVGGRVCSLLGCEPLTPFYTGQSKTEDCGLAPVTKI